MKKLKKSLKEKLDDSAMKRSGYNDLGIGKKDKKKDLDPSFKALTFESLEYIDESDNKEKETIPLKTIKRDINENKKLISKKQLIENTLKENRNISWEGGDLVLYAQNDSETYKFVEHNRDMKDIFEFALKRYIKEIGHLKYDDKETLFYEFASNYEIPEEYQDQLDETTTASSSGQYSTPSMWAPNKKGWANKDKKWWGKNSPNTGGNISKGGIVNIKDNCKGYSNSKTQCNSGDISNITLTEDVKKIINKLSKEYNKKPEYIEKLIKEDCRGNYCKKEINEDWQDHLQNVYSDKEEWLEYDKIYNLAKRLGYSSPIKAWFDNPLIQGSTNPKEYKKEIQEQITDKQISEFVKKQLIKEGYLKQTEKNWRGEGCKNYDDSRDICLDKEEIKEDIYTAGEIPDDNRYGQIDSDNVMDYVIKYENHELGTDKMIELISYLIKSEKIDTMDPGYIEIARRMMLNQDIDNEGNILFSKIPASTPKSADPFSLNEKQLNEFKGMRPVYKNKKTGEVWELSEIYHNSITLTNLKDITQPTIRVSGEELKNDFIKLGSGLKENGYDGGVYGSYKNVLDDSAMMGNDNSVAEQLKKELNKFSK